CTVGEGLAIQGASVGSSRARIAEWAKRNAL
ncbi:MAG TPA: flavodoxin, partial [Sutterella sp.]|nr:flavodoxin [Sutterella sp.]